MEKEERPPPSSTNGDESDDKKRFKRICVFCGSRSGYKSSFGDAALELGKQLVSLFKPRTKLKSREIRRRAVGISNIL